MAAFTEGFTDTTKPGKDHIGSMISKVLAARKFARQEREAAEEKAKKAGYDSLEEAGVEKGFFFKAALKNKFGGSYISGKKQDIEQAVDRVKLLKNPKAQFWNFVDNRDADGKDIKKLSDVERFRRQFDNYNFQSAKRPPEGVKAETPAIPKKMSPFELEQKRQSLSQERMLAETEKKVAAAASGNKQRATREDLLQAINAIAQSLDKTAQSINNSIGDSKQVASDVHAMKTDIVNQLSERTDSIEDKLTKIAEAINAQTALKKKQTDDAEGTVKESNLEKQAKVVTTDIAEDTTDDTKDLKDAASNIKLDYNPGSDDESPSNDVKEGPQAERGAILSGPDSGYKVPGLTLHGNEAIVPLDNNYTQGEPSAVDGKVRPTPSEPMVPPMNVNVNNSYEMGKSFSNVNNSYEEGTPMGKSSPIEIPNLMADSSLEQPLVDAMALPTKVAGGMALAASSELVKRLSGDSPEVASEMAKVITPLASVFDLPKSLVGKAKAGESLKKEPSILTGGDEEKKEKKNVFQKVFDGLKNLFNPDNDPAPPKDTHNPSTTGSGEAGEMISTGAKTTYYDPSLGGINASGHKTAEGLPATSTGEGYKEDVFSAAAFPPLLATLPKNMTVPAARFPGGRTLKKPFNVVVTNTKTGKSAVVRVNDVGPGVEGHSSNHMLDLSVAAKNYLGTGEGYSIAYAKPGSKPGPLVEPKPEPKTTGDTSDLEAQSKSSQGITETFGARTGERIYFEHDGKQYNAFKLGGGGFDLYRGSMKIDTTGGKNAAILKSFIEYGQERVKPPATKPPATKVDPTQAMRGSTAAEKAQVAMINMGGEQTQSAATGAVPTSQGTTVAPSVSSLSKSVFTVDGVTT
jgi:hypothetical protein